MGSSATLYFGTVYASSTRNHLNQWLFKNSDKKIQKDLYHDGEDTEEIELFIFQSTVGTIKKRLELAGFTLEACRRDLRESIRKWFSDNKESIEDGGPEALTLKVLRENRELKPWIDAFRTIKERKLEPAVVTMFVDEDQDNPLVQYLIGHGDSYTEDVFGNYNYPASEFNYFARVLLEVCDDEELVVLDATELSNAGYYDGFDSISYINRPHTKYFEYFKAGLDSVVGLTKKRSYKPDEEVLARMFYSNLITLLETYLSETLIKTVTSFRPLKRRLLEMDTDFKNMKTDYSEVFKILEDIDQKVTTYLQGLMFHNLAKIKELYRNILFVEFPQDLKKVYKAIDVRHDLVHRNGVTKDEERIVVAFKEVRDLADVLLDLVKTIDLQVKNVYPAMIALSDDDD